MPAKAMNAAFLFDPGKALISYEHPMDIAIAPSIGRNQYKIRVHVLLNLMKASFGGTDSGRERFRH
jgi:hypothetical protein